jgi:hypothetical protein
MLITELFTKDYGRRTEKDDNTAMKLSDLRKSRLSLAQLNRLRIMNDVRALEHEQHLKKVHKQFGAAAAAAGAAGAPAAV